MSYEETMSWDDFTEEWKPDELNIPVRAYWFKDEKYAQVVFAHPRKLTCSQITITGASKTNFETWWEKATAKIDREVIKL